MFNYRKGNFFLTILHKLHSDIQTSLNKSEVTLAVLADHSKAFDTVTYSALTKKLKTFKFSNSFKDLMIDYFSGCQQFVQIDCKTSPNCPVKVGVPQGSILGLILFNIYVHGLNDPAQSSTIQFSDNSKFYKLFNATQFSQGT